MKIVLAIILCALSLFSSAQMQCGKEIDPRVIAFQGGEELTYDVKYSAAVISTSIADVNFRTEVENNSYKITAVGKTRPFYSIFFAMEDVYHTWLDKSTLRPLRTTSSIREGGYQYRTAFDYNWQTNTVKTFGQNIKRGSTYNRTMPLMPCSFDALALFYNLRCVDMSTMTYGVRYHLDLVLEDTVRRVSYRLLGRETRTIEGVGNFRTIKVACQIATSSGDALKDGSEFFIWLSDDKNRIPIYMESPIRVGSIRVYLTSWRRLRFPFDSVIVK